MKIKKVFQTEDGKIFNSEHDAEKHVEIVLGEVEFSFRKYLKSYSGERLLKSHSLTDFGLWEIRGEDRNCDFGGYHHEPYLETVNSTLEDAIKYAIKLPRFYTWGSGGSIKNVAVKSI